MKKAAEPDTTDSAAQKEGANVIYLSMLLIYTKFFLKRRCKTIRVGIDLGIKLLYTINGKNLLVEGLIIGNQDHTIILKQLLIIRINHNQLLSHPAPELPDKQDPAHPRNPY